MDEVQVVGEERVGGRGVEQRHRGSFLRWRRKTGGWLGLPELVRDEGDEPVAALHLTRCVQELSNIHRVRARGLNYKDSALPSAGWWCPPDSRWRISV